MSQRERSGSGSNGLKNKKPKKFILASNLNNAV